MFTEERSWTKLDNVESEKKVTYQDFVSLYKVDVLETLASVNDNRARHLDSELKASHHLSYENWVGMDVHDRVIEKEVENCLAISQGFFC